MLTLYIGNKNYSSWSMRPWLLMKELNIPFNEQREPLVATGGDVDYRTFSPSAKVPCLLDGKVAVWDSLAIIEYIAEVHREVWPGAVEARAWARSAAAEMHSGFGALREQCSMNCGLRVKKLSISAPLQKDIDRLNALWEEGLTRFGGPFLAGNRFTAVDAFYAPVASRIQTYNLSMTENAAAYAQRLLALSGVQEWYNAALQEPWRHPDYEAAALRDATFIADHRIAAS
mgnify:CR=1 FL=1